MFFKDLALSFGIILIMKKAKNYKKLCIR